MLTVCHTQVKWKFRALSRQIGIQTPFCGVARNGWRKRKDGNCAQFEWLLDTLNFCGVNRRRRDLSHKLLSSSQRIIFCLQRENCKFNHSEWLTSQYVLFKCSLLTVKLLRFFRAYFFIWVSTARMLGLSRSFAFYKQLRIHFIPLKKISNLSLAWFSLCCFLLL